jgi:hypothetical protein
MVGHSPCLGLASHVTHFTSYKVIDHHGLDPPGPNLQHVGGVLFDPTKGTNLNILYFSQLSRKYDKLGYV